LIAELKVAETQARDVQIGQPALVDTHNGTVSGSVMRVDPAYRTELSRLTNPDGRTAQGGAPGLEALTGRPTWNGLTTSLCWASGIRAESRHHQLVQADPDAKAAVRVPVKVGAHR